MPPTCYIPLTPTPVLPSVITWPNLIEHFFSQHLYDSARFYAERYYYDSNGNQESLYYLAECYYRLSKMKQAYMILSDTRYSTNNSDKSDKKDKDSNIDISSGPTEKINSIYSMKNKYLFALVCFALHKYEEAENILESNLCPSSSRFINYDELTIDHLKDIPGGSAGAYLLGKICRRQQRKDTAIVFLQLALQVSLNKLPTHVHLIQSSFSPCSNL